LRTFTFGDNIKLFDKLLSLVRSKKKTATCQALRKFERGMEKMPSAGRIDISLNWNDPPVLAIRTLSILIEKFSVVGELFALAVGESDSLEGWWLDHQAYFKRNGGFEPDMRLVWERFELVENFG
jgi:uncharacterized protein YhfF